jgi:CheY-like chemotaxis protein
MSNSVLVVEDHHQLRTLIERTLEKRGYDVRCAATIPEAATMLAERCPCLVLWDPTTLPMSSALIALAGRLGVHIATIPVGITSKGHSIGGAAIITKRLTSLEAMLSILREHCSASEAQAAI